MPTHTTDPTVPATTDRARERLDRFTQAVDGAAGRWDAPTPCDGWTVADVIHHVVDTERQFLVARGLVAEGTEREDDPAAAWRRHRTDILDLLARDGVPETEYDGYFGRTTVAETLADFYGWDKVLHAWDVARATGQDWSVTEAEVDHLEGSLDGWGDAVNAPGMFGPPVAVPDDAPRADRLLGRVGRDPHWTP